MAGKADPWAEEKKSLKTKDAKTFVWTANHLLLQRDPTLTAIVRGYETRLFELALSKDTKPPTARLEAIKALLTLGSDTARLAPMLDSEKSSDLLRTVACAIGGKDARVKAEKAVTALVAKAQKAGDWSPQYDAICTLRYFDDPRVVPALIAALDHPQQAVRREAMYGLGHQRAAEVVPRLVEVLGSTDESQHVAAAGSALTSIGTPEALAALENAKAYAHALSLAKDEIQGRFAIKGLKWFRLPRVDDDLIELATTNDNVDVIDGAIDGLVHRRAPRKLPVFAKHVLKNEDTRWLGRMLIDAMIQLFAVIDVDATIAGELAAAWSGADVAALEEIRDDSEQQRYRIDRKEHEEQLRIAAWRDAVAGKVKNTDKRAIVAQLLSVPE